MKNNFIFLLFILFTSCNGSSKEFCHLASPDGKKYLTFIIVDNWIEPWKSTNKLNSGLYLFVGKYDKTTSLPDEYAKIYYGDWPIGIVWGDKIIFQYGAIEENKLTKNPKIKIIASTTSEEFNRIEEGYKSESGSVKTVYYFDEIFKHPIN